jgi:hypothetical protein
MGRKKIVKTKAEQVWEYLLKNKLATTKEVSKATGVSYTYVHKLMKGIGTPQEVFKAEAQPKQRTRVKLLSQAIALVDDDREEEHGDFRTNAEMIAAYWNTHLQIIDFIKPEDIPVMMTLLKLARSHQKPERTDNYRDAAGYIALAGELAGGK